VTVHLHVQSRARVAVQVMRRAAPAAMAQTSRTLMITWAAPEAAEAGEIRREQLVLAATAERPAAVVVAEDLLSTDRHRAQVAVALAGKFV